MGFVPTTHELPTFVELASYRFFDAIGLRHIEFVAAVNLP
jgi:hypothetical protein